MELRSEQIDFIITDLKERGLKKKNILDEIVDHVSTDVEARMELGETFESAYKNVIENFGKKGLTNLESDIKKARQLFIFVDETITPRNVYYKKSLEGVCLTAFARNIYFIIVVSFLLVGSATMAVLERNNNLPLSIVFCVGAMLLLAVLVLNVFGRTSIIVSNNEVQVSEGVFPFRKDFSFPFEEIKKIYLETGKMDMALKGATTTASIDTIAIVGNTKRNFGRALSPEARYYIINVLKKYYKRR
jgi:hypothetical protein